MIDERCLYDQFEAWLEDVCRAEEPGADIVAYNLGLFEGERGYVAYLIGSIEYDEEDPDWACSEDFVPKQKYFRLPDSAGADWQDVQTMVEKFVSRFVSTPEHGSCFLVNAETITVGFDEGDLSRVR